MSVKKIIKLVERLLVISLTWGLLWSGSICLMVFTSENIVSADPDPQIVDGGIIEFNNTWYVDPSDNLVYKNQTIILNGNLIINSTGSLTFYNVTLIMNCSFNGQYYIEVWGSMYIYDYDDDNSTPEDRSNITSKIPDGTHRFLINVKPNARFEMKNSELHECGWDYTNNKGLTVETDNSKIENNIFSNNYYSIVLKNNNYNVISNNTFYVIFKGISLQSSFNNTIANNDFFGGYFSGIELIDSNDTKIVNNTISNFMSFKSLGFQVGSYTGAGIKIDSSSNVTIVDNKITNITGCESVWRQNGGIGAGIYLESSNQICIFNNTIKNITGGVGGMGQTTGQGDYTDGYTGGIGAGVYLHDSINNTVVNNNITNISGGNGGRGRGNMGYSGTGGRGGHGTGIYLTNSIKNNFEKNNITNIYGAPGGTGGEYGPTGHAGSDFGIFIKKDSYKNTIKDSNTYEGEAVYYFYNVKSIVVLENLNLTVPRTTNLGKIVFVESNGSIVKNSTITNGAGYNGETRGKWKIVEEGGDGRGVFIYSSTNISIISNSISNNYGGGGCIGKQGNHGWSGPGGKGIGIYTELSSNISIIENKITANKGGTGGRSGNIGGGAPGGWGAGIILTTVTDTNIQNNTIYQNVGGRGGYGRDGGAVGGLGAGLILTTVSGTTIEDNRIYLSDGGKGGYGKKPNNYAADGLGYGIQFTKTNDHITIDHNDIYQNGDYGLHMPSSSNDNQISSNNVTYHSLIGIYIRQSYYNNITLNNISNSDKGIYLYQSTNNNFTLNRIFNNKYGIYFISSPYNNITDSKFLFNTGFGIWLSSSNNLKIVGCNLSNNDAGIRFQAKSNATVHFNIIENNTKYGVNNTDSTIMVNATQNWWGSTTGPYHPTKNSLGTGDKVSDYVLFDPWLSLKIENNLPVITNKENKTAVEDKYFETKFVAFDKDMEPLSWKFRSNASWLNWDSEKHMIYGIPTNKDVGSYWVHINVTEESGGFDEHNFTLKVLNVKPEILTSDVTFATEDLPYSNDYDSDDDGQGVIAWSLLSNPSWLNIDSSTGLLSGTPDNDDVGSYLINVSVNDGNGGINYRNFNLNVLNSNDAPSIITTDIVSVDEDEYYEVIYSATDIDVGDDIIWEMTTNASAWLKWGNNNHTLYGTPRNEHVNQYWVRINITDGNSGYDEHYFILTVNNTNDKPEIETQDILTIKEDEYYEVIYSAIDIDIDDTLTWTYESNANAWLNWDSTNHKLYGTPCNEDVGSYWVRINISDGHNGFDEHYFTLEVLNTNDKPIINTMDETSVDEDEFYEVMYFALDDDLGDTIAWTYKSNANAWLNWDSKNHTLFGTPLNEHVGEYWVQINISDAHGGFDEHYFILTVQNINDAPTITNAPNFLEVNAYEDKILDLSPNINDIDNDKTELSLIIESDYVTISGFNIIFNYPNSISFEDVKILVSDGEDVSIPHTISITVHPKDIINPEIITKFPTGINIPVSTNITITFSEPMMKISVEKAFSISPHISGKFGWNDNIFKFDPISDLSYSTKYTITLDNSASDLEGNQLNDSCLWSFETVIQKENGIYIDSDNDGYGDDIDVFPHDEKEWIDTDNDNIGDNADLDDDNDGIQDIDEQNYGTNPLLIDTDGDNYNDDIDDFPLDDTKWEKDEGEQDKKGDEEPIVLLLGIISILIVVLLSLIILFIKGKQKPTITSNSQNTSLQPQQPELHYPTTKIEPQIKLHLPGQQPPSMSSQELHKKSTKSEPTKTQPITSPVKLSFVSQQFTKKTDTNNAQNPVIKNLLSKSRNKHSPEQKQEGNLGFSGNK